MTVIAMTREMGTLGKEVARLVADRLGLTVIHHELVETRNGHAAGAPSEVAHFLEATAEKAARWQEGITHDGYLTPAEVLGLAHHGGVLIRGWGACRLLKGLPNVLSVRVCAPMDRRVTEMQRRLGIPAAEAERAIRRNDAAHARSILAVFADDWQSPLNYDLVLNTGHLSVESCADILTDAAGSPTLSETDDTRRLLADRLLEARIAETLHGAGPLRNRARHVEGVVDHGAVRLFGAVTDGGGATEIEAAVRILPGVARIDNEITRIGRYHAD